ncbi:MAG: hypothetical protein JXB32_15145 [Deltaproteobacteria bacterium]|nr:hypothetical protein [Deltaproteobacteria bacterium]
MGYPGCSVNNQCTSCYDTCVYCQDLNESYCGADDCMTCQPGLTLHVLWSDGTGECR